MGDTKVDEQHLDEVTEDVEARFWMGVAQMFPWIKTGDMPMEASDALRSAMRTAIESWLEVNAPPRTEWEVQYEYAAPRPHEVYRSIGYLMATDEQEARDIVLKGNARELRITSVRQLPADTRTIPLVVQEAFSSTLTQGEIAKRQGFEASPPERTWRFTSPPAGQPQALAEDWAMFVNLLPSYNGWTAAWEYPGFLSWHHKKFQMQLIATPDWESSEQVIVLDLEDEGGELTTFGGKAWDRVIPWPTSERCVETYMQHIAPTLDEINAAAAEYRDAAIRMLQDAGFTPDGDMEVEDAPALCPIDKEAPGAWITVQLFIDARDLTAEPLRSACDNCTRPLDSEGKCRAGCTQEGT